MNQFNGLTIIARTRDAVYIRIPRELRAVCAGGCSCPHCKANPAEVPAWDTLVVPTKREKSGSGEYTRTVHMPDPHTFLESVARFHPEWQYLEVR